MPASSNAFSKACDVSPNFDELLKKLNDDFANLPEKMLEKFCFCFDGLNFDVRRIEQGVSHRFLVNATIGYLPFSIESTERRDAIKAIVIGSRSLPTVRFGVDMASKISAGALFEVDVIVAPDFLFYPLMLFMQEAGPFVRLIGKYLGAPVLAQKKDFQVVKGG